MNPYSEVVSFQNQMFHLLFSEGTKFEVPASCIDANEFSHTSIRDVEGDQKNKNKNIEM